MHGGDAYSGQGDQSVHLVYDPLRATPSSCTVQLDWLREVTLSVGCGVQMRRRREEGPPSAVPLNCDTLMDPRFDAALRGGCCWRNRYYWSGGAVRCGSDLQAGGPATISAEGSSHVFSRVVPVEGTSFFGHDFAAIRAGAHHGGRCLGRDVQMVASRVYDAVEGDYLRGKSVREPLTGRALYTHKAYANSVDGGFVIARTPIAERLDSSVSTIRLGSSRGLRSRGTPMDADECAWIFIGRAMHWGLAAHLLRDGDGTISRPHQGSHCSIIFIPSARWIGKARFPQLRRRGPGENLLCHVKHLHIDSSAYMRVGGRPMLSAVLLGPNLVIVGMQMDQDVSSAARADAWRQGHNYSTTSGSRGVEDTSGCGQANFHWADTHRPSDDDLNRDVNDRVGSMTRRDPGRNEGRDGLGPSPPARPPLRHDVDCRSASPQESVWYGDGDPTTQEGRRPYGQEKAAKGPLFPQEVSTRRTHEDEGNKGGGVSTNELQPTQGDITIDGIGLGDGDHDDVAGAVGDRGADDDGSDEGAGSGVDDDCSHDGGAGATDGGRDDDGDDADGGEVGIGCRPPPLTPPLPPRT